LKYGKIARQLSFESTAPQKSSGSEDRNEALASLSTAGVR